MLVLAAEQIYGAGHGAEKLEYVKTQLELRGITINVSEIEAAVYERLNFFKDYPVPVESPDEDQQEG